MSTASSLPPRDESAAPASRPGRRPRPRSGRGQKPMIWLVGVVFVTFAILNEVWRTQPTGPLWRVFVAIAAFLYLWWLSSLLFDLVFVWHRYIQGDAAHKSLRETVARESFRPRDDSSEGPPDPTPAHLPPLGPAGGSSERVLSHTL
ncbi:hypothetical protein [Opitutus terrae]|nr:hypothetical protein [Opitutus terrae]